jgi:hypothetical protein
MTSELRLILYRLDTILNHFENVVARHIKYLEQLQHKK